MKIWRTKQFANTVRINGLRHGSPFIRFQPLLHVEKSHSR